MKNLLFTAFTCVVGVLSAQQGNTLPTEGNVGLGTLNPSAKLDVNGNVHIDSTLKVKKGLTAEEEVRFTNLEQLNPNPGEEFMLIRPNGKIYRGNSAVIAEWLGEQLYEEKNCVVQNPTWFNGTNKIFTNCPDVYVGIATNEPKFHLDVQGTSYSRKLALGNLTNTQVPAIFYLRSPLNQNTSEKLLVIENNARKILQLNNNGLLQARELKLDVQDWPDYVFEADYKLPALQEVEQHIKNFGHLPKVPAANSMEAEGINVAEMDKILMEKVEEITLYLIELNKQVERQGRQITAIEHQLEK